MQRNFLFVALIIMSVATPALAQEHEGDDERARAHFMAGTSYFEHRRFNEAAEQFYDAYRLSGRAALLLNAANAYELARELTLAAETLERYLNLLPEDDANRLRIDHGDVGPLPVKAG